MRRSEIIAREALSTGDAIKRDGHDVERNSYEIAVEDVAHPHVLSICVRASHCDSAGSHLTRRSLNDGLVK